MIQIVFFHKVEKVVPKNMSYSFTSKSFFNIQLYKEII